MSSSVSGRVLGLAALVSLAACISAGNSRMTQQLAPAGGRVIEITQDRITEMSVRSAWEIVRRGAPAVQLDQVESPSRPQYAGRSRFNGMPLLVVDGAQVMDVRYLADIPASWVQTIRILDGNDGAALYGSRAAGGVIEVVTKR